MIDTIVLRVHGIDAISDSLKTHLDISSGHRVDNFVLPEHNELYKKMMRKRGKHHSMRTMVSRNVHRTTAMTDEEFLLVENSKKLSKQFLDTNVMYLVDEREVKEIIMSTKGDYRVPSSYHGITFNINKSKGCIDFQLSIPKYLYGHSLAEFIPQIDSHNYRSHYMDMKTWKRQSSMLYKRLHEFIDTFIVDLCSYYELDTLLNKKYIELVRIDFCKNQFFDTKSDSLMYLKQLQKFNYRRYKNNAKAPVEYNSSLSYTSSQGNYFKVYHKGTEYSESKHGDLKKHNLINRQWLDSKEKTISKSLIETYKSRKEFMLHVFEEAGKGSIPVMDEKTKKEISPMLESIYAKIPFKTKWFKEEMDKVLRYEISLKSQWMSYVYKTKIYRRKDTRHKMSIALYKKTKAEYDSRTIAKTYKITKEHKRNHDMIHKWLHKKVCFVLESNPLLDRHSRVSNSDYSKTTDVYDIKGYSYSNTILSTHEVAHFSEDFMLLCLSHFRKKYKEYQIDKISSFDDVSIKVQEFNKNVDKRVADYNKKNHHLTKPRTKQEGYDPGSGLVLIRSGRVVTKASQLLTQSQQRKMGMKKLNAVRVLTVTNLMAKKFSPRQIRIEMKFSNSQWSRMKSDLAQLEIFENSMLNDKMITTCLDWKHYYKWTDSPSVRKYFFIKKIHSRNG